MRRTLRLAFWLAVVVGAAWFVQRWQRDRPVPAPATPATPTASQRPAHAAAPSPAVPAAWVVPEPGGACPASHPIKAKLSSKIFHLPGMLAYDRTNPDRCYRDEAAAEGDGLRKAKR